MNFSMTGQETVTLENRKLRYRGDAWACLILWLLKF